jgi:A/G-specific adenine glycosylase
VSEVMLQQTQVARVAPVFRRFIAKFPTPVELADASFADVVVAWGDLGYLRRARNLHAAAHQITNAGWPENLTELPGVGPYTAAAVSAFADDAPVAAVDVNVRRILSRWTGTVLSPVGAASVGSETLDEKRPGDWNQAMMDLGAGLCRPRSPRCVECPVRRWCSDPSLDLPSRRQSLFEGSVRQARAAVLKRLAVTDDDLDGVTSATGLAPGTVHRAVEALVSEGTVVHECGRLSLA